MHRENFAIGRGSKANASVAVTCIDVRKAALALTLWPAAGRYNAQQALGRRSNPSFPHPSHHLLDQLQRCVHELQRTI